MLSAALAAVDPVSASAIWEWTALGEQLDFRLLEQLAVLRWVKVG